MDTDQFAIWWPILGVAVMRPLGIILFLPIFNKATLGGLLIRNAVVLLSVIPIFPSLILVDIPDPMRYSVQYFSLLCSELALGALMGFTAAIPFWVIDMAGFILDTVRGASIGAIFNPELKAQSSPLGIFFSQILTILFFVLNGFHALLSGMYQSYQLFPPGASWHWSHQFVPFLLRQWEVLWTLSIMFAMPGLIIMLLLDLALGLLNRSAQQLNVFFLSMPIKSIAVLLILLISIQYSFSNLLEQFFRFNTDLPLQHMIMLNQDN